MPVDNFNIVKQKQYNAFSYTTMGLILSYLQESYIDEDNGSNNLHIDSVRIVNQDEIHKKGNANQRND